MIIQERIEAVGNASYLHSRVSPSTYAYGYFFHSHNEVRPSLHRSEREKVVHEILIRPGILKIFEYPSPTQLKESLPYAAVRPLVNSITAFATTVR